MLFMLMLFTMTGLTPRFSSGGEGIISGSLHSGETPLSMWPKTGGD